MFKFLLWYTALSRQLVHAKSSLPSAIEAQRHATYINYATDVLDGDDGLPPHPMQPLPYGKPVYPITTDGNGREQAEAHLTYFEGKYWIHAATWGCGGNNFVYGRLTSKNYPSIPTYPVANNGEDGDCGIKSYPSDDLPIRR